MNSYHEVGEDNACQGKKLFFWKYLASIAIYGRKQSQIHDWQIDLCLNNVSKVRLSTEVHL